ncbi:MAG: hypothetical protein ACTSRI_13555 [Promethearchaeota archaeon]
MDTSNNNRINPNNEVTPDLIVQLNNSYGIICEAKKSFPKNKEYWNKNFEQLIKYDDDLRGWKTKDKYINISDLVLLSHYKLKVEISDYLEEAISNNDLRFNKKFCLIAFQRAQEVKIAINLEKGYGNLSDHILDERFRKIIPVPLYNVVPLSNIKLFDEKPELPYIMELLWGKIFSQYPTMEEYMESRGIKILNITVNIDQLTEQLRIQYTDYDENDNRQPSIPDTKWIKEAMEMFVELNYAKKDETDENTYIVKYKNIPSTLRKFTNEICKLEEKKKVKTINHFL